MTMPRTPSYTIVCDLEAVHDNAAFARIQGVCDLAPDDADEQVGDKFQKLRLRRIAYLRALIAESADSHLITRLPGALHVREHSEAEIMRDVVGRVVFRSAHGAVR